ncbi:hypothetical protein PAXRUDRAFT_160004 [Paxillus rubicundulus Ve08.2h10]|uniref:Uncharacterized protein n=1 Tax=Paxillus rubicundulus Ve08.2h10 TaxID=930991 RepID=A0A0D0DN38_9AGAM|nr:hypothetical protein PAXRUDRAFT_160004 [Paxillus rubicundulus Ve08.2h10]
MLVNLLYQWIKIPSSIARFFAPYILRVFVGLILLINIRSFPLLWHVRVFLPLAIVRCKYHFIFYKHLLSFKPAAARHHAAVIQLESLCPVGANPFTFTVLCKSWASPDDCDFLGHLSNSSYAKIRDVALAQFSVKACPTFVGVGGCVILGSSHYQFLREIPLFARYEIKLSIGAWDQKWMYLVCRFTAQSKNEGKTKAKQNTSPVLPIESSTPSRIRIPTPMTPSGPESPDPCSDRITKTLVASLLAEDPDGPTVLCFSISRVCFKIGRITVPPPLLLACEGFSKPPSSGSYSHDAPPPHWIHPHTLRHSPGSLENYHGFLTKFWRDVAEEDRWWIEPLSGPVEEQRLANLAKLDAMQSVVNVCMDVAPYA